MATLKDYAYILRSKNAGPFYFTFDIIFQHEDGYRHVVKSNIITKENIANLYLCDPKDVQLFEFEQVASIKISIPRRYSSGDLYDTDVFGAQQHVPLMNIEV